MSLALGGLFFSVLQWATAAGWSAVTRRVSESIASVLPFFLLTFFVLIQGANSLYSWTDLNMIKEFPALQEKTGYLNLSFFIIRNTLVLFLLIGFCWFFLKNSLRQDQHPNEAKALFLRNRFVTPLFFIVFTLGFSLQSFDQIMSLDPFWVSTIFGVYCFSGLFYSALALTAILTSVLISQNAFKGAVREDHVHDLGKYLFAFTVFWAYIAFSQFVLIWYANLPEEIIYYEKRFSGEWIYVTWFLIAKFLVPFFCLLPRHFKRNHRVLFYVGIFMLIAQWIDVLWLTQPERYGAPLFGWIEIGILLGFIGFFGILLSRFLGRYSVIAIHDPFLSESLEHHQ
jgi:hypothetical protein